MKIPLCSLTILFLSAGAHAGTVIYTDHAHPVSGELSPDVTVTGLDAPDRLQSQIFGQLSVNPGQAEQQARAVITSPSFRQNQQALAASYAGVAHAWSLGLEKVPAVVFDDKWVVYGTTDVAAARAKLDAWREKQP
ncbi:TIGR03757 family integrating conjugative element protein [Pantoea stewartii]|uniref:TIGR03757 family integrating conjugative element protein n=1 Tax=Pantoea stewartii TaxID=66269 RepID=UPI002DBA473E|nr:TIGR03757 family integrating conjugative element protein [Pantoea stewartii]MEB6535931.1 TIGR03757 family integrating conjugative element protein [Pantoea stewartii]